MQTLKKNWLWIVGALVLIAAAVPVLGKTVFGAQPANAAATQTGQVTRGDIESQVTSSAALQPAARRLPSFGTASGPVPRRRSGSASRMGSIALAVAGR